jgi:hypothetical protein
MAFVVGLSLPMCLAAVAGAVYGWNQGKEVGDSFEVWFRPGAGTAFFYAYMFVLGFGLLPGLILAAGLAAARNWKNRTISTRTDNQ